MPEPSRHHRPASAPSGTRALWLTVAALCLAALMAWVFARVDTALGEPGAVVDTTSKAPTAAASTAAPTTLSESEQQAQTREDFIAQAATERGWQPFFQLTENLPGLALNVCGTLEDRPTSAGVWTAAANLERTPFFFDQQAAWGFVDLAVTVYCPVHHELVLTTTASVSG